MPACQLTRQQRRGRAELNLEGAFDGAAGWELVKRLSEERGEIVLDFSRIATFDDYGLAVLAHALHERQGRPVRLAGLRTHQLRMLHYLGVEMSADGLVGQGPDPLATQLVAIAR